MLRDLLSLTILSCVAEICSSEAYIPPLASSPEVISARNQYNPSFRNPEGNAAILRLAAETSENGYHYSYETENGIQAAETGQEADGIQAEGSYSYTGDDGQVYSVTYTAGANGFQARGAHIPTPPPLPAEIAAALEQNARDELNGIFDDGSYKETGSYPPSNQPINSFPSNNYPQTDFALQEPEAPDVEIIAARQQSFTHDNQVIGNSYENQGYPRRQGRSGRRIVDTRYKLAGAN